jgi:glycosyltransferase involved in cell wall biosynthesis
MKKLVIIQTTTPDYRAVFYKSIYNSLKENFEIYSGDCYFESSVKSSDKVQRNRINNYFLLNRKFLFQTGVWHLLFKDIVLVLEMNPRILSNWFFLIVRNLFRKKTVLWGHAWPRSGALSKSDFVRGLMRKLASKIIVYTKQQQKELNKIMPNKQVLVAPNAVISSSKMRTTIIGDFNNLIYVGRLTKLKKPFFLLKAFHKCLKKLPLETKLVIVGEGEEKKGLEKYIKENNLEERVEMTGHLSDYHTLQELYLSSFFSVSPGYIGLSITQSFSFGVPMIVSKNENHSPEIEAVIENENAIFFNTDDIDDFNEVLLNLFKNKTKWINKKESIINFCKKEYSVESMSKVFIDLCK